MSNPPVFPIEKHLRTDFSIAEQLGMTLRDYFAAKAMQGITSTLSGTAPVLYDAIADDAYEIADAMLKAREQ